MVTETQPKSFKVACDVGEGKPCYNAQRWPTAAEAKRAGDDLFRRWMLMRGFEVEPSDDEPNYRFDDEGRQVRIEGAP